MNEASQNLLDQSLLGFDSSMLSPGSEAGLSPSDLLDGLMIGKSGPEAVPVSPSHQQAKAAASRTSATSGPNSYGSSPSAALQQSLESRLLQKLDVNGSLEYALTWKRWDMPSGPPICALRASVRRTSASVSIGWPTTKATDGTHGGPRENGGDLTAAAALVGWEKTPQASDGDGGVMEIRPGTTGKYKLRDFAQLAGWATAAATTWGGTAEAHLERKRKAIEAGSSMGLVVSCLDQQVTLAGWPTATARDERHEGKDGPNRTGSPSLPGLITELFLVPTGKRVVLAPEFSLWLMGFPEAWVTAAPGAKDWREAQAALALECSKDQETPSFQNLPPDS